MRLIERYLFDELTKPTLAATLALGGVAVLSQSLSLFDIIVDQRQSTLTFLKIVALSMPQLFSLVLPVALFIAALVAINRLHTEQEIVVCYAGGMSRWAVTAPAFRLAAIAAVLTLAVNLWVAPWSAREMRDELFRVRTDLAASLVRDGEFTEPAQGLTVYAQSLDAAGRLRNVFIDQHKNDGSSSTFTAKTGEVIKQNGKPALVLRQGSNQQYNKSGVLNYLAFEDYVLDLTGYLDSDAVLAYKTGDRYLHELVFPDLRQPWERGNRKKLLADAHFRLASPLYNITFVALALAGVLGGSFSRLGYGRRIAIVAGLAIVIRSLGFGVQAACNSAAWLNILQYVIPILPAWLSIRALYPREPATNLGLLPTIGRASPFSQRLEPLGAG